MCVSTRYCCIALPSCNRWPHCQYRSAAAAAKSLQSCPTLCDTIVSSPPGSPVPGILQASTLEWLPFPSPVHESEKWKWSRSVHPWDFPGKSTGVGCHCLLRNTGLGISKSSPTLGITNYLFFRFFFPIWWLWNGISSLIFAFPCLHFLPIH